MATSGITLGLVIEPLLFLIFMALMRRSKIWGQYARDSLNEINWLITTGLAVIGTVYFQNPILGGMSVISLLALIVTITYDPNTDIPRRTVLYTYCTAQILILFMILLRQYTGYLGLCIFEPGIFIVAGLTVAVTMNIFVDDIFLMYFHYMTNDILQGWSVVAVHIIYVLSPGIYWWYGLYANVPILHYLGMGSCLFALRRSLRNLFVAYESRSRQDDIGQWLLFLAFLGAWIWNHPNHFV